jgi:8-oxo-dGDP phosphatase
MEVPHAQRWIGSVRDESDAAPVLDDMPRFDGHVWSVRTQRIDLGPAGVVERDVLIHPGAVGVAAIDAEGRILLIRQYRHPVGGFLFELPAGLRDVADEPPLATAQRELVEEAGLLANRWDVLVDFFNSPGGSSEAFRCYLARELHVAPGGRAQTGEAEEMSLPQAWLPLSEAVDLVLAGHLHNPSTVVGVLAAAEASRRAWASLRPAQGPMWSLAAPPVP